ncbi:MAG TPA: Ig-like domain-containing protein, partial [Gammaproteobacteria bacterium]|nr:Ig-like domain-containing protein [Gammaproteobacteria bacterium]
QLNSAGASASQPFKVSQPTNVFQISSPSKDPTPVYETGSGGHTITVTGSSASQVTFSTSVGQWSNGKSVHTVSVSSGTASDQLQSSVAGIADVLVEETGPTNPSSDTMNVAFTAPLSQASRIVLQGDPRVVPVSGGGVSYTADLVATVETSKGEPVANAPVSFEMVDTTGGGETISPPSLLTGTNGEAVATFTSGTKASSTSGITLQASVPSTSLKDTFDMVITNQPGSVVIGQASEVQTNSTNTAYILPMSVLVSDANGNPVEGATVTLSNWPTYYHTGFWAQDQKGNWGPFYTGTFANEDVNENNNLDAGEDLNGDGEVTPKNSVAGNIPRTVTTDASGL